MIENPITWPSGYQCAVSFSFDMDAVRREVAAGWTPRVDRLPFWPAPLSGTPLEKGVRAD